jgi:hypothetical protein
LVEWASVELLYFLLVSGDILIAAIIALNM